MNIKTHKSFTIIETIVVITIIGLIMPLIFSIIFVIVREQTKMYRLSVVKREGDNVINSVSNLIKDNAFSIYPEEPNDLNEVCKTIEEYPLPTDPPITSLFFKDQNENWFSINYSDNKISSYSAPINSTFNLNSDNVIISDFIISCNKTSLYSPAFVSINFNICYKTGIDTCQSINPEENASLHYQTSITLRNY